MKIYLIRHAAPFREGISEEGKKQARFAAWNLKVRGVKRENSRLFSSPVGRARATAEIIASEVELHLPEAVAWLDLNAESYDFVVKGILVAANRDDNRRHIVIVGHAPILEKFLSGFLKDKKVSMEHGDVYEVDLDTQKVEKLG